MTQTVLNPGTVARTLVIYAVVAGDFVWLTAGMITETLAGAAGSMLVPVEL